VADAAPETTATLAGTLTAELLLDSATTEFDEADLLRVTVQVEVAPLATLAGLQLKDVTAGGVTVTDTVVCAVPLKVAVMVAVCAVKELAVAKKVADAAPETTVTPAGTVTAALLLERVTTELAVADLLRLTVQVEVAPLAMLAGLQLKDVTCAGLVTVTDTVVCAVPLKVAVRVAACAVEELAVARKVADAAPETTVTLAGTVTAALLLERVTTELAAAALFRFTVQVEVAPLAMLAGLQLKDVTTGAVTVTDTVVCAVPLKVAVRVAVCAVEELAVARKVADAAPETTVTLAGTVTASLLLVSATTEFAVADLLRVTVQVEVAPLATLAGLQLKDVTPAGAATVTDTVVWAVPLKDAVRVAV
jgi:hypothetical protein